MSSEVRFPATLASLHALTAFVRSHAEAAGFGPVRLQEIDLALEEVLVNIFHYAYPDEGGEVSVACTAESDGHLRIEIADEGVPFNPLTRETPDLDADIAERGIGGLGIFFVKRLIGDLDYRREGQRNVLILRASAAPAPEAEPPP